MNIKALKGSLLLFAAAIFWGSAFVAQDIGLNYIGPYGLNATRFVLGAIFLTPLILIFGKIQVKNGATKEELKKQRKGSIIPGIICGLSLALASNFQQMGLVYTTPGKSGFITSMYIILVPVAGIFFHKKTKINVWIAVGISTVGLALLSIPDDFSINFGDILTMICAVGFVANILLIDKFAGQSDGVVMSFFQLLTAGVVTFIPLLISGEAFTIQMIADAKWCIIYIAFFSCCLAYTFQILGQKSTPPAVASVLMSLESVFSLVFSFLAMKAGLPVEEHFTLKELFGALLIFIAIILCQLDFKKKERTNKQL